MVVAKPISATQPLILASSSARRQELLRRIGVPFVIRPAAIPELRLADEPWEAAVARLAQEKAGAAWTPGEWVLAADTVVLVEELGLGKPQHREDGARMLRRLAGRSHTVLTGFCLLQPAGAVVAAQVVRTRVRFRELDEAEIAAYLDSGEPFGKAGAYAIQGIGAALVAGIDGSYTNVVGLPLAEVLQALRLAGALPEPTFRAGHPAQEEP